MTQDTACAHGRLAFSRGGARVICLDCPEEWDRVPRVDDEERQAPLGLGKGDVRLAPRLVLPKPTGNGDAS